MDISGSASASRATASRTALIVGAGIGGLSAGIALRQAGWNVRIFERAASPRELGFGLALAPNAIAALRELGVADVVLARSAEPTRGELRRMDGTVLKRADLPPSVLGGPLVIALRPALHGALLETVGPSSITFNSEATSFVSDDRHVALQFANGQSIEGDLLVGADGSGSVIRRALHPSEPPARSSCLVSVRGSVHGALQHLGDLSGVYYLGPGVESVIIRASETGIYWYLSVARELVPEGLRDPREIVAHLAPRFDATFRAVTSVTDELRYDELVDRDPLPFWGKGVVTLLGDAAHPLLPHTGQGAAQAIVDGVALGKILRGEVDVASALRSYELDRRAKTAALLARGRRTANLMRTTSPIANRLREIAVQLIPAKTVARLMVTINRRAGTDVT